MRLSPHLLLLAGAGEARDIAKTLAAHHKIRVTASLHYPERAFGPLAVLTRIGGFGGDAKFVEYLHTEGVTAVLDATHSFATHISFRSAAICATAGLPYAQLLRPQWRADPGDNWFNVKDETGVPLVIPPGARVFTTTGRASLGGFKHLQAAHLFVRQLNEGGEKKQIRNVTYLFGAAPFSVEEERALFKELEIDWLVARNVGGDASRSKLDAARILGLPVAMIRRPAQPDSTKVETIEQALIWVAQQ